MPPLEQVTTDCGGDRDQCVRASAQRPFDGRESPRLPGGEVPFEHVPVVRVDQSRGRMSTDARVVQQRGGAADRSGFCGVRVHDRGTKSAEESEHASHCRRRPPGLPTERRHVRHIELAIVRDQISHVALARPEPAVDEQRLAAQRVEARAHLDGLNRRSADVQARDDARDTDGCGSGIGREHASATLL
jgi:hypothetical protein